MTELRESELRAPFPWFGGKSRVANVVWRAFGDVGNYVEPFAGSLAVLLGRPGTDFQSETVNDLDCYLANFWRTMSLDPDGIAKHADWPINEADLHARHQWLVNQEEFRERMKVDPNLYDARIAGWWLWGLSQWIGDRWCHQDYYNGKRPHRPMPSTGHSGVHRKIFENEDDIAANMRRIAKRMRKVTVLCGDWKRVLSYAITTNKGMTACFLDPPYGLGDAGYAGGAGDGVWEEVSQWAAENGSNPLFRIALCGYDGQPAPKDWTVYAWKSQGGYASTEEAMANSRRERIWLSPACLPLISPQQELFT